MSKRSDKYSSSRSRTSTSRYQIKQSCYIEQVSTKVSENAIVSTKWVKSVNLSICQCGSYTSLHDELKCLSSETCQSVNAVVTLHFSMNWSDYQELPQMTRAGQLAQRRCQLFFPTSGRFAPLKQVPSPCCARIMISPSWVKCGTEGQRTSLAFMVK